MPHGTPTLTDTAMDSEFFQQVEELFFAALDLPATEREALLRAGARDEKVVARVWSMLRAHFDEQGFSEAGAPGDGVHAALAAEERTETDQPERIGDYLVEGMKFNMPGYWEVTFTVTAAAGSDAATFDLVLP